MRGAGVVQGEAVARLHYWVRESGGAFSGRRTWRGLGGRGTVAAGAGLRMGRRSGARRAMDVLASAVDWSDEAGRLCLRRLSRQAGRHFVAEAATVGGFRHVPWLDRLP